MISASAKPLLDAALCEMLLRQSPGCTWMMKPDGRIHAVYGEARRLFGRAAADLESVNFTDLFPPPARPSWISRLHRVLRGERLGAAARFGEGAAFFITMFPIQWPDGEIAFAGGMAREMPEGDIMLRLLEGLESDRARLPRLLHDHVGQSLSAAGLQLDLLRMDLAESAAPIPQRIDEIQAMLETAMGMVRDVGREFNPAVAERAGLRAALDWLAGRLRADFKGNVRLFTDATARPAPEVAAALYRIAEEAAGLAARRAGCSAIEILLKSMRTGLALEIRDNGRVFDTADMVPGGAGLEVLVMQHFADRAGIELRIHSAPDTGTVVLAIFPPVARALPPADRLVRKGD